MVIEIVNKIVLSMSSYKKLCKVSDGEVDTSFDGWVSSECLEITIVAPTSSPMELELNALVCISGTGEITYCETEYILSGQQRDAIQELRDELLLFIEEE